MRYGWGWTPNCWQGWLVLAAFVALLAAGARWLRPHAHPAGFIAYAVALSILLTLVCWLKGEKPRWRWGGH